MQAAVKRWRARKAGYAAYQTAKLDEESLFSLMQESLDTTEPTLSVIDVLDECDNEPKLVEDLMDLYEHSDCPLKILVMRRHQHRNFMTAKQSHLFSSVFLDDKNDSISEDIKSFVQPMVEARMISRYEAKAINLVVDKVKGLKVYLASNSQRYMCGSLLECDPSTGEVSFCHYSPKEFLVSDRKLKPVALSREKRHDHDDETSIDI
ncbi:hypothetical protein B0J13DRAFT_531645 [Dactylonectria estremocensis]|uniref:Nephrocystin 3-like N-terminal domain-containing protein n=1 Tax=Dactylonectria estremocensis TaxID=1079267 RepID=A0A9P9IJX1_9HYPO|nr:hypothetical protein B0J13DRAFT_531645 [Dactylonectria estremocensis]